MLWIAFLIPLVVAVAIVIVGSLSGEPSSEIEAGPAPGFSLPTTAGGLVSLDEILSGGDDALLYFSMGVGCDGCFAQIPEAIEGLAARGVNLVPVMVDPPGGVYWRNWDRNVRQDLMSAGLVSPEDLGLYMVTDDAQDAADHVLQFYRNYHSQRFVREHLAIRMQRPLTDAQIGALGDEFSDLVAEGGMAQGGPLDGETEHLNLTRLSFISTRRDYGRLRMLIDRINSMDAANHPQRPAANADI